MIGLIIGTNRPDSSTFQVAKHVAQNYKDLGVLLKVLDLAKLPPETFAPEAYAKKPKTFESFAEAIIQSAGLVVVTPEYNGSLPGVLKYFLDLLKFPESLYRRPACFIGLSAGRWGGLRPVEHLQQIFGYRQAFIYPERVFLSQIHELLGETGQITDPESLGRLKSQAAGFVDFVERLQGQKLRGAIQGN
jgi:chromate reductase